MVVFKVSNSNVRTLKSISLISELAVNAIDFHKIILCVQTHIPVLEEHDLEHHKLNNNWTFVPASTWKSSLDSTIGRGGFKVK